MRYKLNRITRDQVLVDNMVPDAYAFLVGGPHGQYVCFSTASVMAVAFDSDDRGCVLQLTAL